MRLGLLVLAFSMLLGAQPKGIVRPRIGGKGRPMRQVEKFSRMTPKERKRVIEKLPPDRQKEVERNLENYQKLTPDEKKRLNNQLESFRSLPPERQQRVRRMYREINQMPPERKVAMRREMAKMRRMTPEERDTRIESEEFKGAFSEDERKMIRELATLMPDEQD